MSCAPQDALPSPQGVERGQRLSDSPQWRPPRRSVRTALFPDNEPTPAPVALIQDHPQGPKDISTSGDTAQGPAGIASPEAAAVAPEPEPEPVASGPIAFEGRAGRRRVLQQAGTSMKLRPGLRVADRSTGRERVAKWVQSAEASQEGGGANSGEASQNSGAARPPVTTRFAAAGPTEGATAPLENPGALPEAPHHRGTSFRRTNEWVEAAVVSQYEAAAPGEGAGEQPRRRRQPRRLQRPLGPNPDSSEQLDANQPESGLYPKTLRPAPGAEEACAPGGKRRATEEAEAAEGGEAARDWEDSAAAARGPSFEAGWEPRVMLQARCSVRRATFSG